MPRVRAWKCLFTRWSRVEKKKKKHRVSFKSRWNDWHFHYWWMSKRVPKFQCSKCISTLRMWNVISFSFLFYFYYENLTFNILINRRSVDIKYLRIKSIQLICIVFTPDINLSAPRVTYCRSSTIIFQDVIFFNEGTKAVNVEGV